MARFVFELEAVLRMRLREEERAMLALAERERARTEQVRAATEIEMRAAMGRLEWRDRLAIATGGIEMTGLRMQAGSTLRDLALLKRAALSVAAAERVVAKAREELLEATRRRQAIEELRERRLEAWKSERQRFEQRVVDDLVVSRFGRGDGGPERSAEGAW